MGHPPTGKLHSLSLAVVARVQVLEAVIRYRWISLAPELRDGVKNYLSNLTIKLASDEAVFRRDRALVSKVNVLLVQVSETPKP
jgi:exportin-1